MKTLMDAVRGHQRWLWRYVVAVAGLAACALAGVLASADPHHRGGVAAFIVVAALAGGSLSFPLLKTGTAGARTYQLLETAVTAGLLLLDPRRCLLAFTLGIAVGWLASGRPVIKKVFGIGEHTLAAGLAVLLIDAAGRLHWPGAPGAYVPVALVVYFGVNLVLNCAVFDLAGLRRPGEPFLLELGPSVLVASAATAIGLFVGLVGRSGSEQVLLATIPVALVMLLARAYGNRGRTVDLLQGIIAAVADTHAGMSTEEVEEAVCQRVAQVLDCPSAEIRIEPPTGPEMGVVVPTDGRVRWLIAHPRPVEAFRKEETDLLRALAGVAARALDNASLQEQLSRLALHDPLTGAPNRRLLVNELEAALARARRSGEHAGVAFLDLTEFKGINDKLGHDAGDDLLRQVYERLVQRVRAGDVVGRLGGDEFVVVFPTLDEAAAGSVGARVLSAFDRPFALGEQVVRVHGNVGVAVWPADGESAEELLRRADAAMYTAKRAGGNTIAYASTLREEIVLP
jgi:diguanylate cyclase (GGDEF)-like protein